MSEIITTLEPTKLELVIDQSGIEKNSALVVRGAFNSFFLQAIEWQAKVETVTDPKEARASRLLLKKIRVEAEHKKNDLKADALRYNRAVDQAFRLIESTTEELESKLESVEKKAEREEAARREALRQVRANELAPYNVNTTFFDLVNMPEDAFKQLLESSRIAHEAKIAAAKKAEEDRIAREKKEAEEREKQRIENERLKREAFEQEQRLQKERAEAAAKEAALRKEREAAEEAARKHKDELEAKAKAEREAIEAKARAEREAAEAQARKEREAREKAEAQLKAARDTEEAKRNADESARKKAERAPDREKVLALAKTLRELGIPQLKSQEGRLLEAQIVDRFRKFADWLEKKGGEL